MHNQSSSAEMQQLSERHALGSGADNQTRPPSQKPAEAARNILASHCLLRLRNQEPAFHSRRLVVQAHPSAICLHGAPRSSRNHVAPPHP